MDVLAKADLVDVSYAPEKLEWFERRAEPERLTGFVSTVLTRLGVPEADADDAAGVLVAADLRGSATHGVALLASHYVEGLESGEVNPTPAMRMVQRSHTTATLDGDRGLGMLVSLRAARAAVSMARKHGSGWVSAFNSTHAAAGAPYVELATRENMLGFWWSTGGNTVAAPGGSGRLVGNNPFAFGAPAGVDGPFVLDMAPSATIRPKLAMRGWAGQDVPAGWAVDAAGEPIDSAAGFFERQAAILPLGADAGAGHKGFGLLLLSDIMTGALNGDGGSLVRHKGGQSQAFGALSVDGFGDSGTFASAMAAIAERIHGAPTLRGGSSLRLPGESGNRERARRAAGGIPLQRYVVDDLSALAKRLGLDLGPVWKAES